VRILLALGMCLFALALPGLASAWGPKGHAIIARMAYAQLNPRASAAVDKLLALDRDTLTGTDLAARASWADAYARKKPETAPWHFINIQVDDPDIDTACDNVRSAISNDNCLVRRLQTVEAQLASPNTSVADRIIAFKFVLHLVGDVHQPLHAADNQDLSGSCVPIATGATGTTDLLRYWDDIVVEGLGHDTAALADRLISEITPAERERWRRGGPEDWALESFTLARMRVYSLDSAPACASDTAPLFLPPGYTTEAEQVTRLQLKRAAVRLASVLNRILGSSSFSLTELQRQAPAADVNAR
jgi:hypothetical protein